MEHRRMKCKCWELTNETMKILLVPRHSYKTDAITRQD